MRCPRCPFVSCRIQRCPSHLKSITMMSVGPRCVFLRRVCRSRYVVVCPSSGKLLVLSKGCSFHPFVSASLASAPCFKPAPHCPHKTFREPLQLNAQQLLVKTLAFVFSPQSFRSLLCACAAQAFLVLYD